jgi:hypothetical protein
MSDQREDQERPCLHCLIVERSTISSQNIRLPRWVRQGRYRRGTKSSRRSGRGQVSIGQAVLALLSDLAWRRLSGLVCMAKAKSGIGNAVRRAVKHGIETVSSHAAKQALA